MKKRLYDEYLRRLFEVNDEKAFIEPDNKKGELK